MYDNGRGEDDLVVEYDQGVCSKLKRHAVPLLAATSLVLAGAFLIALYFAIDGKSGGNDVMCPPSSNTGDSDLGDNYNVGADANEKYYENRASPQAFSVDDMVRADRLSGAVVSPDGTRMAFFRRVWSVEFNRSATTLYVTDLPAPTQSTFIPNEGTALTPFFWDASESDACWSSDSTQLIFLSNRVLHSKGSTQLTQVFSVHVDGSELKQLTDYPVAVTSLLWDPTNTVMALSAEIYPGMSMQQSAAHAETVRSGGPRSYLYTKLFVRHWDRWFDGQRSHVFMQLTQVKPGQSVSLSGAAQDLTPQLDADIPTKPFGDRSQWSWSSDGLQFAFVRQYDEDTSVAWNTNLDVFLTSRPDTASVAFSAPVSFTAQNKATDTMPVFSPDGKRIAYLSMAVPGYESDRQRVKVYDTASAELLTLTEQVDLSFSEVAWSSDGSQLYAVALWQARERLYRISSGSASSAQPAELTNQNSVSGLQVLPDDAGIVLSVQSMMFPLQLALWKPSYAAPMPLTAFNHAMSDKVLLSEPEDIWFVGAYDQMVHGFVMKPVIFAPNKQYPVALLIHGGPQGSWDEAFSYRWNPQFYAGAGYAVIMIDPHGSTGYGQAFTNNVTNNYGGAPFYDIMTGLDDVLANNSAWMSSENVVALGASYGGFMINWINGHTTDKFNALVCHDGIFEQHSMMYYSTEEIFFPEHDMLGPEFDNPDTYTRWNPQAFVKNWTTPQLTIHGGLDFRIPETHGIGAFTALQRQGIESKLLYFPLENHWVTNPVNSVEWHHQVLAWIDAHVQKV